jgi:hypothetical protein
LCPYSFALQLLHFNRSLWDFKDISLMSSRHARETATGLKLLSPRSASTLTTTSTLQSALRKMALFLAETWKQDHPDASSESKEDVDACVLYITVELSKAARAVGGVAGVTVLSGGGSEAAQFACQRVLSQGSPSCSID